MAENNVDFLSLSSGADRRLNAAFQGSCADTKNNDHCQDEDDEDDDSPLANTRLFLDYEEQEKVMMLSSTKKKKSSMNLSPDLTATQTQSQILKPVSQPVNTQVTNFSISTPEIEQTQKSTLNIIDGKMSTLNNSNVTNQAMGNAVMQPVATPLTESTSCSSSSSSSSQRDSQFSDIQTKNDNNNILKSNWNSDTPLQNQNLNFHTSSQTQMQFTTSGTSTNSDSNFSQGASSSTPSTSLEINSRTSSLLLSNSSSLVKSRTSLIGTSQSLDLEPSQSANLIDSVSGSEWYYSTKIVNHNVTVADTHGPNKLQIQDQVDNTVTQTQAATTVSVTTTSTNNIKFPWHLCAAQCLNYFSVISARMAIFPIISALETTVPNWNSTTTGFCLAMGNLIHLITALFQGAITDRFPGALCTVFLSFGVSSALLGLSFCSQLDTVIVGYGLLRFLATPSWAAQGKLVQASYTENQYDRIWSFVALSSRLGMWGSISVIDYLLVTLNFPWRVTIRIIALIEFLLWLITMPVLLNSDSSEGPGGLGEKGPSNTNYGSVQILAKKLRKMKWREVKKSITNSMNNKFISGGMQKFNKHLLNSRFSSTKGQNNNNTNVRSSCVNTSKPSLSQSQTVSLQNLDPLHVSNDSDHVNLNLNLSSLLSSNSNSVPVVSTELPQIIGRKTGSPTVASISNRIRESPLGKFVTQSANWVINKSLRTGFTGSGSQNHNGTGQYQMSGLLGQTEFDNEFDILGTQQTLESRLGDSFHNVNNKLNTSPGSQQWQSQQQLHWKFSYNTQMNDDINFNQTEAQGQGQSQSLIPLLTSTSTETERASATDLYAARYFSVLSPERKSEPSESKSESLSTEKLLNYNRQQNVNSDIRLGVTQSLTSINSDSESSTLITPQKDSNCTNTNCNNISSVPLNLNQNADSVSNINTAPQSSMVQIVQENGRTVVKKQPGLNSTLNSYNQSDSEIQNHDKSQFTNDDFSTSQYMDQVPQRSTIDKLRRIFSTVEFWLICLNSILANILLEFLGFGKLFILETYSTSDSEVTESSASSITSLFLTGQVLALVIAIIAPKKTKNMDSEETVQQDVQDNHINNKLQYNNGNAKASTESAEQLQDSDSNSINWNSKLESIDTDDGFNDFYGYSSHNMKNLSDSESRGHGLNESQESESDTQYGTTTFGHATVNGQTDAEIQQQEHNYYNYQQSQQQSNVLERDELDKRRQTIRNILQSRQRRLQYQKSRKSRWEEEIDIDDDDDFQGNGNFSQYYYSSCFKQFLLSIHNAFCPLFIRRKDVSLNSENIYDLESVVDWQGNRTYGFNYNNNDSTGNLSLNTSKDLVPLIADDQYDTNDNDYYDQQANNVGQFQSSNLASETTRVTSSDRKQGRCNQYYWYNKDLEQYESKNSPFLAPGSSSWSSYNMIIACLRKIGFMKVYSISLSVMSVIFYRILIRPFTFFQTRCLKILPKHQLILFCTALVVISVQVFERESRRIVRHNDTATSIASAELQDLETINSETLLVRDEAYIMQTESELNKNQHKSQLNKNQHESLIQHASESYDSQLTKLKISSFFFGFGLAMPMLLPGALFCTYFGSEDDTALMLGIIDSLGYAAAGVFDHIIGGLRTRTTSTSSLASSTMTSELAWHEIWNIMSWVAIAMLINLMVLFWRDTSFLE